LSVLC